jgi:hypothetical protein
MVDPAPGYQTQIMPYSMRGISFGRVDEMAS